MPSISVLVVIQVIVALGLLNVWLIRSRSSTRYRGSQSQTLKAEFAAYGLPDGVFYVVGFLKISAALCLIAGIWMPELVLPAAGLVAALMLGAIAMHLKVKDPWMKSVPAVMMLLMSGAVLFLG